MHSVAVFGVSSVLNADAFSMGSSSAGYYSLILEATVLTTQPVFSVRRRGVFVSWTRRMNWSTQIKCMVECMNWTNWRSRGSVFEARKLSAWLSAWIEPIGDEEDWVYNGSWRRRGFLPIVADSYRLKMVEKFSQVEFSLGLPCHAVSRLKMVEKFM